MKKDLLFEKDIHIYAILTVLCIFFFNQIIFGKYYFFEDFLFQYYPFRNFFITSLRQGTFPLWDPYVFAGMSLIGDIQSALFYPFNIILLLFVKKGILSFYALELQNILHILLAGIFTFMYTREIKFSKYASLVSSVTFMFSGFLITRTIHLTFVNVIIWLPLILLFLHKALKEKSYFYAILGGLFMGISMLAGSPQFSLHIFYFIGFYTIFFAVTNRKDYPITKSLSLFIIIIIISLGISAIQYLPAFEYSKYTVRGSISFDESTVLSIRPIQILTLLIPKLFGSLSGTGKFNVPFWIADGAYGAFWENAIYIGILPLILMGFGFKERKDKLLWFFTGMAIFSLLAALGKYTPLYKLIYYCFPGFNKFRIPGRFSSVLSFSLAILAGFGANFLFSKKKIKFPKAIFWIAGFFFIVWTLVYAGAFKNINRFTSNIHVYNNIKTQYSVFILFLYLSFTIVFIRTKKLLPINTLAAASVILIFIDLFTFGHNFNKSQTSPQQFYQFNSMVRQLKGESQQENFRINSRKEGQMILRRNSGNIYKLELIEGYTPLRNERFVEFSKIPLERKLDLFNVKYKLEIDKEKRMFNLMLNESYLPRAFMVYEYTVEKNKDNILKILSSPEFDYRNKIILEESPEIELPKIGDKKGYRIEKQNFETNCISLKVHTEIPGLLVLSEIYNPSWQASIDGNRTKIYRADYLLRAIPVESGTHQVELIYSPHSFRVGRTITILTLILAVCLLFLL